MNTQVHTNTLALLGIDEKKKGFRKPDDIADSYFVMWKIRDLSCGWLHIRLFRLYIITRQELNTPKKKNTKLETTNCTVKIEKEHEEWGIG